MSSKPSKRSKPQQPRQHECKAPDKQFCAFKLSNRPANMGGSQHNRWACTNEGCGHVVYN